eukprot:2622524-Ditylum_brightwellii.AAC.2
MDAGFQLRVDDNVAGFLGIKLDQQDYGSIELKQTALIQKIIDILEFENANRKAIPVEVAELPVDVDGQGPQEHWSYMSVISMLMYLAANSGPDISMAVH